MRARINLCLTPSDKTAKDPLDSIDRFEKVVMPLTTTLHSVYVTHKGDLTVELDLFVPVGKTISSTASRVLAILADNGYDLDPKGSPPFVEVLQP